MKRFALAAVIAGSMIGASGPASARDGISPGGAAALGVIGGMALGAAIGANARPAPPPPVYVEPAPRRVYVEPAPRRVYVEEPVEETCVVERHRVWVPGYGWEWRRRTVCD